MPSAIDIRAVAKHYRGVAALDGITASVPAGQVVGLLGHNGAGKSTLIKLILGLIRPTRGRIDVLGESPWDKTATALRQRVGYLPENVAFYGNLTGREVMHYLARLKSAPRAQADDLLERVGLAGSRDRRVATYSKGMRQRLGLAQALLGKPELVLLDEPTSGLDPQATAALYHIIGELRAAGHSVIVSSHLLAELEPHIDAALILGHGRLLASDTLTALRRRSGLPDLIHVRVQPAVNPAVLAGVLRANGATCAIRADGRIEIEVGVGDKLALLQRLSADPSVADISVHDASLARLYAQLETALEVPGEARPCPAL